MNERFTARAWKCGGKAFRQVEADAQLAQLRVRVVVEEGRVQLEQPTW